MVRLLDLTPEQLKPYTNVISEIGIGAGLLFAEFKTSFILTQITTLLNIETLEKQTASICTMVISICLAITAVVRLFYVLKGSKMSKEEKKALEELHAHTKESIELLEKQKGSK